MASSQLSVASEKLVECRREGKFAIACCDAHLERLVSSLQLGCWISSSGDRVARSSCGQQLDRRPMAPAIRKRQRRNAHIYEYRFPAKVGDLKKIAVARTDRNGKFEFGTIPSGHYFLAIEVKGSDRMGGWFDVEVTGAVRATKRHHYRCFTNQSRLYRGT